MPETGLVTTAVGPLMAGRKGLVLGVANERSLAWGVARAVAAHGAQLAFTYQGDALRKRVGPLAERTGSNIVLPCDVAENGALDATVDQAAERLGGLDFLVHAIAFSDKTELTGKYVETTRDNFLRALSYMPEDGSDYEGPVYCRYVAICFLIYADLLHQQAGEDLHDS